MYEHHWRLNRPAFDNDLDPEFFFGARSHHGALLKLRYLIESRKSLGVLVGDYGLGKTYLTHVLQQQLEPESLQFVRIVFPLLRADELLRFVSRQLSGLPSDDAPTATTDAVLARLQAHLAARAAAGRRTVLIVDDAHLLDPAVLQALQLLLNLTAECGGMTLLLVGRSDLLPRLNRLPPLATRIAVRSCLQPLTLDEAQQYVAHRARCAGVTGTLLEPAAVRTAFELSRGVPRLLNQLCDLALLVGFADNLSSLSPVEIQAAAEELTTVTCD